MIVPRRFAGIKRFEQILGVLSRHGLDFMLEKSGLKRKKLFTRKYVSRPVEVRIIFEELGGAFLKLGQFLSLRPDLIPKEYSEELSKLQDSVHPFSYEEASHVISSELKNPIKKIFKEFSKEPVASASIGQVYRARLKNGKLVAVKVMRPGIAAQVETDIEILDYLARQIKHYLNPKVFDPEEIFAEFKRYTENELDYLKEAKNLKMFAGTKASKDVFMPKVYSEFTTKKVLCMEYMEGVPLSHVLRSPGTYKKIDRKKICSKLAASFLNQVFFDGFFHADPHPGNILVSNNQIGLLDFGIVGRINDDLRDKLSNILISVINKDADGLAAGVAALDISECAVDVASLRDDIVYEMSEYYDAPIDQIDIPGVFFKSLHIARKHKMKMPADFVLLVKCMVTLKLVCAELEPKFNIVQECKPVIARMIADKKKPRNVFNRLMVESTKFAMFIKDVPAQSRKFYRVLDKADLALDDINRDLRFLTTEFRKEAIRVIIAVIIASLIISASVTTTVDRTLSRVLLVFAGVFMLYLILSIVKDGLFRRKF